MAKLGPEMWLSGEVYNLFTRRRPRFNFCSPHSPICKIISIVRDFCDRETWVLGVFGALGFGQAYISK